jgi:5-methylcytosine-specific restriction protein B
MGEVWRVIRSHIDEVFFGDVRGIATVLNVREQLGQHIYVLEDRLFGDEPRLAIQGPTPVPEQALYKLLKAVRG